MGIRGTLRKEVEEVGRHESTTTLPLYIMVALELGERSRVDLVLVKEEGCINPACNSARGTTVCVLKAFEAVNSNDVL